MIAHIVADMFKQKNKILSNTFLIGGQEIVFIGNYGKCYIFLPVRNFRNSLLKKGQRSIFRLFYKLFSPIILCVRNFRVFEILLHLP